ncbi:hypothetical protein BRADI_1g08875v3 [Brachypodium distachyon]|uniref:Uncharacterized protein n=1 Tax=Brachypodium distachyon TaxID=15368 RepID=A0A0Q3GQM8_BRADI|nr:hypothetical protein BRADI_1g08875v3 [Brachypodium distachyon]
MPRIGETGAIPAARVGFELGLLASSIVVRHIWREYLIPSVDPDILPVFLEFGAEVIGYTCFIYTSLFFVLDAIDSPYARGWR